ncbi:MAG: hypothetical protein ACRERS_03890, partial [Methylococcales bacterium]
LTRMIGKSGQSGSSAVDQSILGQPPGYCRLAPTVQARLSDSRPCGHGLSPRATTTQTSDHASLRKPLVLGISTTPCRGRNGPARLTLGTAQSSQQREYVVRSFARKTGIPKHRLDAGATTSLNG